MRKIAVIRTIKSAFSCVVKNPKVVIPFLAFAAILLLILGYFFVQMTEFQFFPPEEYVMQEEPPFEALGDFFQFMAFMVIASLFIFLIFPFFEGWTLAAVAPAYANEPVSLVEALRKALSKYFGLLGITIIVTIACLVVSFILSIFFVVVTFFSMMRHPFPSPEPYASVPTEFMFSEFFITYSVMFLILAIFMVIFIYMKPAYIVSGKSLSESLGDGFEMAKKNFVPSCLIYLFFLVGQTVLCGVPQAIVIFGGIIDFDSFFYQGFEGMISTIFLIGAVTVCVYALVNSVMYTALVYAYMDSHEMVD